MKKAVLTMAQEDFDFSVRQGKIEFSVEKVELEFVTEEVRKGSFSLKCDHDVPMKGFVYSTSSRMKLSGEAFEGAEPEIQYEFDSTGMEPGDSVTGSFIVLSDKGEYSLPFEATMEKDYMYSSMGYIKNLFHFANLARTNWDEAVSLYYSNRFAEILTGNDKQYLCAYRGLSTEEGNEPSVDEFLILVRKKSRNTYELPSKHVVYRSVPDDKEKEIILNVNGWGYVRAEVTKTGDFIRLAKKVYTVDDLSEGEIDIKYLVDRSRLHKGRNFGKIIISTPQEKFEVDVIVECSPIDMEHSANHIYKQTVARLMREYIDFRLGKVTSGEWVETSSAGLSKLTVKGERAVYVRLYEIQLLLAAGKEEEAARHMEEFESEVRNPENTLSPTACGYYLYLTSMLHPEKDYVDKVAHKVKKLAHKSPRNPVLAWILIYLREDLTFRDDRRWEFLEEQYHSGISSPLLYTEAVHLLSKQPSLLVKLSEYERRVLKFALSRGAVTPSVGERVQFLISREKDYDELLFDVMRTTYKQAPSKELLQSICTLLMRGNKTGPDVLSWYEEAVKADIRITRLYEFYMASVPSDYKDMLPKMVMMYFAYQNHLDYERMALLYANVSDYKALVPEVAVSYEATVTDFLKEQIKKGRINKNLIKLYKKYIKAEDIDASLASSFAPVLFAHEVKINRPDIRRVIVIHSKAVGEGKFPVHDGVAYPTIYSKEYCILLEDEKGNRYLYDSMVKPAPVLYTKEFRDAILPMVEGRVGILLNVCENEARDEEVSEKNSEIYETLLTSDSVTFTLKKEILYNLCKYYFENDMIRELDRLLYMAKPEVLPASDRAEMLHILVARGFYEMAFKWLAVFGMEHVEQKTCLRLLSRYLERTDYAEEANMKKLCSELYRNCRFDQVLLRYLVDYFNGTTAEMMELLHFCESFGVDSYRLVERVLIQMLFTGADGPERENMYQRFVKGGGGTAVRKAYLAESAYGYFVGDYKVPESIFAEAEALYREGEELNRICLLAYVKHSSDFPKEKWNIPVLAAIVGREVKNNVVFPFFLKFASVIPDVLPFTDRTFVEYRANAESRVIMHYAIERENSDNPEYRKEEMDNLYYGFFVKDFILFAGDKVSYYITEETGNKEQLTLSATLEKKESDPELIPWRYEMLNRAVEKREEGQDAVCGEELKDYARLDFITKQLFKVSE